MTTFFSPVHTAFIVGFIIGAAAAIFISEFVVMLRNAGKKKLSKVIDDVS